jgi:hypothetical protein
LMAVAVEREQAIAAIVRAFDVERRELMRTIEAQRVATLEWATAERHMRSRRCAANSGARWNCCAASARSF